MVMIATVNEKKIYYKDLNGFLKTTVVLFWISLISFIIIPFLVGVVWGLIYG